MNSTTKAIIGLGCLTSMTALAQNSKTNIIYILTDDMGYGDLSCYGQKKFQTPNVDRLAKEGMKFTRHYSGSTVCAPSRCSLLTGLHTGHAPIRGNKEHKPEGQLPMPEGTVTIPKMLKSAGYTTGMFGKWGLGYPGSSSDPLVHFDRFYGYNCQRMAHSFYPTHVWDDDKKVMLNRKVYSHDLIMDNAFEFIEKNSKEKKLFFCYLSILIPHAAMHAPKELHDKYRKLYPQFEKRKNGYGYPTVTNPVAAFPAMMEHLDNGIGELLDLLKKLKIDENTIVCFTSDNGTHQEGGHDPNFWDSNGPLRGKKRDLYEGGIRVPFLVRWPKYVKPGTQSDHVSAFWDMMPTFAQIARMKAPKNSDGVSILPTLLGRRQATHPYLYWEFGERTGDQAILKDKYKLIKKGHKRGKLVTELFNLENDEGEKKNIAKQYPELVQELEALMNQARTKSDKFEFIRK